MALGMAIHRVEISERDYYKLPAAAHELIRAYSSPVKASAPNLIAFELAEYRWPEIEAALAKGKALE